MATAFAEAQLPLTQVTSWKSKAERNTLVLDIQRALAGLGLEFEIDDQPRDVTVIIHGPKLHADVWIGIDENPTTVPIISWFNASSLLKPVDGAWRAEDINNVHRRKATSHPATFEGLIEALRLGFQASIDGSAFLSGVEND